MYERYYCVNDLPKARQQRPSAPHGGIGRVVLSRWFIIEIKIGMLQVRNNGICIFLCAEVAANDAA
jgi:hypothetical protein